MSVPTIAAISTSLHSGAIGMVRLSGSAALEIADKVLKPVGRRTPLNAKGYTAVYGKLISDDEVFDDGVMFIYKAPKSYTGENVVEICCHGSAYILTKLLGAVLDAGAVQAAPGEFTMRAFLNGKMNLAEAESVADQIAAHSLAANRAALAERDGVLTKKVDEISGALVDISAHIAAWCDYPEEDVEELSARVLIEVLKTAQNELENLVSSYQSTRYIKDGIATAIVGKPNVGKSTLMNLLSGSERSIVTDIPGTTRDVVENTVRLENDIVLNLADTAGIHQSEDVIEKIGIELADKRLESAALVLAVADVSRPLEQTDINILEKLKNRPAVIAANKADAGVNEETYKKLQSYGIVQKISAKTGDGRAELAGKISHVMGLASFDPTAAHIANERQLRAVKLALVHIEDAKTAAESGISLDAVGVTIETALDALYAISGKTASDDIVTKVFENFCVGK